ncbi:hypothetical protein RV10_GL003652 [Enterococcus pallens]|nr:hypothetical protein RV10_GL003652 [Enterococcus pallens]
MTQAEVAQKIGVTRPAYTSYETGKREPAYENLISLAELFEVSTDYLLGKQSSNVAIEKKLREKTDAIAIHIGDEITDEEMKEILTFIDFIKHRDGDRSN